MHLTENTCTTNIRDRGLDEIHANFKLLVCTAPSLSLEIACCPVWLGFRLPASVFVGLRLALCDSFAATDLHVMPASYTSQKNDAAVFAALGRPFLRSFDTCSPPDTSQNRCDPPPFYIPVAPERPPYEYSQLQTLDPPTMMVRGFVSILSPVGVAAMVRANFTLLS